MPQFPRALLLVLADPPPPLEEEFNDWYDTEHLPERAAVPGVETALRFRGQGDGPGYAALYDLASRAVLDSDAYRAVSGANFSPWTRRVTARVKPRRMVAEQVQPGGTTPPCTRLMLVIATGATAADLPAFRSGLDRAIGADPGLIDLRLFAGVEPQPDFLLALAAFGGTALPALPGAAFGPLAGRIATVATFRSYRA